MLVFKLFDVKATGGGWQ